MSTKPSLPADVELAKILADRAPVVDEFLPLDLEVKRLKAELKPKENKHKALSDKIKSWFSELPGENEYEAFGTTGKVLVSMKENKRTILSMKKLYKAMKLSLDQFLEKCSMTLEVVDALLKPDAQKDIVEQKRTGSRTLTAIQNPCPKPEAKA